MTLNIRLLGVGMVLWGELVEEEVDEVFIVEAFGRIQRFQL